MNETAPPPVARVAGVSQRYGETVALADVTVDLPAGRMLGLVGPDGVGKSTLLALISGVRKIQSGTVEVLGADLASEAHRVAVCSRIAYMPQGLGRNLYPTLSVFENVEFFGRLFGQSAKERAWRIEELLTSTGLARFADRPAGKLSGGMKQKLGLCCSLIHDPDLLILDEPTTGVDPLSRRQFWELIDRIRARRAGMSVVVATAYMEEAESFDWLVAMDAGKVLATGSADEIKARTGAGRLEEAFIALLPEAKRAGHRAITVPPRSGEAGGGAAIEAEGLTKRFGNFTAVDHVSFRIERGEIFGFLGSNGCGKTTTMKMLTGLLPASEGTARVFGQSPDAHDLETRKRVGFMSQNFSLYSELTVAQNLDLHARLYHLPPDKIADRVADLVQRFGLGEYLDDMSGELPLGIRQRLSLAVAVIHEPEMLILDEPTSGVDPVARDQFWELLIYLSRESGVTIFISTHFMNEAGRCDRISLMHAGKVLACDAPAALTAAREAQTLEQTFIAYLEEAAPEPPPVEPPARAVAEPAHGVATRSAFSPRRLLAYARREMLEIRRDPVRLAFALFGTVLLMLIFGYGISLDVEKIAYAVLDRDDTTLSRDYGQNIAGSRYFSERAPIRNYAELETRMRSGELQLVLEIPPGFARDVKRDRSPEIGAWIDGAMPFRAETVRGYVEGLHESWLAAYARQNGLHTAAPARHYRSALPLQPGFQEHLRDGALDDRLAARLHSSGADGCGCRRGKGAGLDHKFLRDTGDATRIPLRKATSLRRHRHPEFLDHVRNGALRIPRAPQGGLPSPRHGRGALCLGDDRPRTAHVLLHEDTARRNLRHGYRHDDARHAILRHDDARRFAHRRRANHWHIFSHDLFHPDYGRHLHQGARLRRPHPGIPRPRRLHPRVHPFEPCLSQKAGDVM